MRLSAPTFVCLALLFFGNSVWAQGTPTTPAEWASRFALEEVLMRRSDDPVLRSPLALPQPKLILEATNGGTQAKARVGLAFGKNRVLDLQVESPKTSEETTLATLDGLSDSGTVGLGFTWIFWNPDACARKMIAANSRNWMSKVSQSLAKGKSTDSRPSALAVLEQDGYQGALEDAQKVLKDYIPVFLTVSAKAGKSDFHFVDSSALKSSKESHIGRQFDAAVGMYLQGSTYSSLSYSRGTAFKSGPTKDLCTPFGSTSALECRKVDFGPPTEAKTEALALEFRRLFKTFGIAARLTRDLEENVTGVEVPIYLLRKIGASDMEFNGGIAAKWRSDTNEFVLSLFVGPTLSTTF